MFSWCEWGIRFGCVSQINKFWRKFVPFMIIPIFLWNRKDLSLANFPLVFLHNNLLAKRSDNKVFFEIRLRVVPLFSSGIVERGVSPFLAWCDFHARSRFACSIIPEGKWGTTRSLLWNISFVFYWFYYRYVVEPYRKYPNLLEVLLNFLKTEQAPGIRREVTFVRSLYTGIP